MLRIPLFIILLLSCVGSSGEAQDMVTLWEGLEKPYYKENTLKEREKTSSFGVTCAYDITEPTLTVFEAEGTSFMP